MAVVFSCRNARSQTLNHHILCSQDFPYNYAPGIRHYNVWCTRPLPPAELASIVEQHVPSTTHDTLTFVNPAALASIPSVWHAHVLAKAKAR